MSTATLGLAWWQAGQTILDTLAVADIALYDAKRARGPHTAALAPRGAARATTIT